MLDIDATFEPDPEVVLAEIGRAIEKATEEAVELLALEIWGNIREEAPVDHGLLAGSWQLSRAGALAWLIASQVEYAAHVETGTRPHVIRPKVPGGVLHFEVRGADVFARSVSHPGTAAQPYIGPSIDSAERRRVEFVRTALTRAGL